jgi:hypothetical protein
MYIVSRLEIREEHEDEIECLLKNAILPLMSAFDGLSSTKLSTSKISRSREIPGRGMRGATPT